VYSDGADVEKMRELISSIYDEDKSRGPLFVRLSSHASGTYDRKTGSGGSAGATMRFEPEADHEANAGLKFARDLLEPVKAANPDASYADIWTLAGVTAIEKMGGPKVDFALGRADATGADDKRFKQTPGDRLPAASSKDSDEATVAHLREVFGRMGFDDKELVCLSLAFSLGR
jgi:catalase (peroxidase I)